MFLDRATSRPGIVRIGGRVAQTLNGRLLRSGRVRDPPLRLAVSGARLARNGGVSTVSASGHRSNVLLRNRVLWSRFARAFHGLMTEFRRLAIVDSRFHRFFAAYKVAHVRQVELPPADLSLFVSQLQHRNRRKVHALPLDAAMALSALADGQ